MIGDLEALPQYFDLDLVAQIQRIAKIGLPAFVHGNLARKGHVARDVAALRRHGSVDDGTGCPRELAVAAYATPGQGQRSFNDETACYERAGSV